MALAFPAVVDNDGGSSPPPQEKNKEEAALGKGAIQLVIGATCRRHMGESGYEQVVGNVKIGVVLEVLGTKGGTLSECQRQCHC